MGFKSYNSIINSAKAGLDRTPAPLSNHFYIQLASLICLSCTILAATRILICSMSSPPLATILSVKTSADGTVIAIILASTPCAYICLANSYDIIV